MEKWIPAVKAHLRSRQDLIVGLLPNGNLGLHNIIQLLGHADVGVRLEYAAELVCENIRNTRYMFKHIQLQLPRLADHPIAILPPNPRGGVERHDELGLIHHL